MTAMLRSQLIKSLQRQAGSYGVITKRQLMQFLGYKDRHSVAKYLIGVTRLGAGYSIEDVADSIMAVERRKS